jgi:hypothetical protein
MSSTKRNGAKPKCRTRLIVATALGGTAPLSVVATQAAWTNAAYASTTGCPYSNNDHDHAITQSSRTTNAGIEINEVSPTSQSIDDGGFITQEEWLFPKNSHGVGNDAWIEAGYINGSAGSLGPGSEPFWADQRHSTNTSDFHTHRFSRGISPSNHGSVEWQLRIYPAGSHSWDIGLTAPASSAHPVTALGLSTGDPSNQAAAWQAGLETTCAQPESDEWKPHGLIALGLKTYNTTTKTYTWGYNGWPDASTPTTYGTHHTGNVHASWAVTDDKLYVSEST